MMHSPEFLHQCAKERHSRYLREAKYHRPIRFRKRLAHALQRVAGWIDPEPVAAPPSQPTTRGRSATSPR